MRFFCVDAVPPGIGDALPSPKKGGTYTWDGPLCSSQRDAPLTQIQWLKKRHA